MATPRQIEANRRNGKKSTGPKTDEGKSRSRFNAVKHGMTAETAVLPGEDAAAYQARVDAWKADLGTRGAIDDYLIERAAKISWQLDRVDRAHTARLAGMMETAPVAEGRREAEEAEEAEELGRRLFWDRRGPIALYPHFPLRDELSPDRKPRVSFSRLIDDPDDPPRLIVRLESNLAGCQWLLERWQELRVVLLEEMPWQSPDKLKAVRLMGRQPLDVADNADVAEVFLASWVLDPHVEEIDAFEELWKEMLPPEVNLYRQRLLGREIDDYVPEDKAAARAALLKVVDMYVTRLESLAASHRDRAQARAQAADRLAFDPTDEGERLRRYELGCGRALLRTLGMVLKVHKTDLSQGEIDRPAAAIETVHDAPLTEAAVTEVRPDHPDRAPEPEPEPQLQLQPQPGPNLQEPIGPIATEWDVPIDAATTVVVADRRLPVAVLASIVALLIAVLARSSSGESRESRETNPISGPPTISAPFSPRAIASHGGPNRQDRGPSNGPTRAPDRPPAGWVSSTLGPRSTLQPGRKWCVDHSFLDCEASALQNRMIAGASSCAVASRGTFGSSDVVAEPCPVATRE